MPGVKRKVKVKKIKAGDIDPRLSATFRPGRIRSRPTGKRIRKSGGVVKKTGGGMTRQGLSPAEEARSGTMSQAKRKKYMKSGGAVKRKTGGTVKRKGGGIAKRKKY